MSADRFGNIDEPIAILEEIKKDNLGKIEDLKKLIPNYDVQLVVELEKQNDAIDYAIQCINYADCY